MSSNDKNQTNDTQKQNLTQGEPLTEKEVASKKPAILLSILILLIIAIVGVFGYMVNVAMKEDAIDQSVAAVKMQENEARLAVDTEGETLAPSVELTEKCSFYSKLTSSQSVSVLVIGDIFGTGAGAEGGSNWIDLLQEGLKESFGSDVTVKNLSLANRNDAYSAYVSLMNEASGNKDTVYDAVIISLGYYDDPFNFKLQYEGILRAVKKNYGASEIIGIIESPAVTDTEGYSDETALYARELISYYGGIVANMGEAFAVTGKDYSALTVDGVLPNAEGQKLYADWMLKKIGEKLFGTGESAADFKSEIPVAVNPDSELYDQYHYIPADSFLRADDLNFIIGIKDLSTLSVENVGMLGIDYDYVEGKNTVQIVLDRKIFAGLQNEYEGTEPERHIRIVNNNATVYEEMAVSFATKEQADAFHGIIMTGNLNLHQGEEKYDKLPMPPETTAPPETETEIEETDGSKKEETKAADSKKKKSDDSDDETKRDSENRRNSGSSNRTSTPQPQPTAAPVPETVPETAAVTPETTAETAPTVPSGVEGPVISDPANSGNIETAAPAPYTVEAGQGIDVEQWNAVGPTVG